MGKPLQHGWHFFFFIFLSAILSACGGGGGGSEPENALPSAVISYANNGPLSIRFDASNSSDSDGTITSYEWNLGDGNTASGIQVNHTYAVAGDYTVQLTVTDDDGATAVADQMVTITVDTVGDDPLFSLQWHLNNTGQRGNNNAVATIGEDLNVTPVWEQCNNGSTCRGEGIVTSVVDDGLEIRHEDLSDNILAGQSYNYLNGSSDPTTNNASDAHGTAVGGIISARDGNNLGGRGVAPRGQLVGYNLLTSFTALNEGDAMTRGIGVVDLSNNSWGPPDGFGQVNNSEAPWRAGIENGVTNGRGGRGISYLWAGGNGHPADNSNYDAYANNPYVIAIGAYNAQGQRSSYSELGANILVSAPGGEFCDTLAIVTTDLPLGDGFNNGSSSNDLNNANYTQCMNGTSSAAPNSAGVVALILQANPELTWRDVRRILASSARRNDASDSGWFQNGAGYWVNDQYGFGAIDAEAAVNTARNWTNMPAQQVVTTTLKTVNQPIPDNNLNGIDDTITVSNSNISNLEFVQLTFSAADHPYSGDLTIELISPSGTVSVLSQTHGCRIYQDGQFVEAGTCTSLNAWTFGSVQNMGESVDGLWQIRVADGASVDTGTFQSWQLTFYGY